MTRSAFKISILATTLGTCAIAIFFLSVLPAYAAFGISPPFLNADHLVPGSTYTQTIYLVQDEPNADLPIAVSLNVPDAVKSWFSVDKGMNFVIPAGTRQFPVTISVTVPKNAGLGDYNGNIVFASAPGQTGQVTIALAAQVAVSLTVGNNIFEKYSVPLITFPSIEEGWSPRVTIRFENDGNVPESFDSATFDLYDQYDAVRLAYVTKDSGFPATPPFTTNEYTIEFPTDFHLGVGDYWGDVTFYKNNQVVATEHTIFHVLPAGSLSPLGRTFAIFTSYWIYWLIGALALIVIIWFWRAARQKKTRHVPMPTPHNMRDR